MQRSEYGSNSLASSPTLAYRPSGDDRRRSFPMASIAQCGSVIDAILAFTLRDWRGERLT